MGKELRLEQKALWKELGLRAGEGLSWESGQRSYEKVGGRWALE